MPWLNTAHPLSSDNDVQLLSLDGCPTNVKWTIMDGYLSLLTTSNRLLRLLLGYPDGIRDSELLPQRCKGVEAICEGIELRIDCVSLDARIALKTLIGLPAELQIVTDNRGGETSRQIDDAELARE